jgi:DNA repair protein RecN (Recombination protein N)
MLRRLCLRDFVIVRELEVDFDAGFSVLTGETGAGKSILIDALQLALGSRGDALVVREGAARADISAAFDAPLSLKSWLVEGGFDNDGGDELLLRRTVDSGAKSRAWINGSPATLAQLREAAEHLVDIHGQHAWQSLTRPHAVRELLDARAGVDAPELAALWSRWKVATDALEAARSNQDERERERERLTWQIGEVAKLAPGDDEWDALNAEHQRLSHAQALLDAARRALDALSESEANAESLVAQAAGALGEVSDYDARLAGTIDVLQGAQAQLQDAAHSLNAYLNHTELDPDRLAELDARLSAWMSLARRYRRPPTELPALLAQWQQELSQLEAASDLASLERDAAQAQTAYRQCAQRASTARAAACPPLAAAVTQAMQQLGMSGGRFEVALLPQEPPQSYGLESVEFLVAGHAGSTPRSLSKVASGGELSRLALAIAVTTATESAHGTPTLIFDEIDAGVGGTVADTVGRMMKHLGLNAQVLAVTHLAQVAACADRHYVVAKAERDGSTLSDVQRVHGEVRVAEVARMLGARGSGVGLAHAQEMLSSAEDAVPSPRRPQRSRA